MRYALLSFAIIGGIAQATEVYFSPHDGLRNKLINRIKQEKEGIKAALYLLTDKEVANALSHAAQRGVKVEMVVDKNCMQTEWGKIPALAEQDIAIFLYDGGEQSILHHKFFIFERNAHGRKAVWTGSYNPTVKAHTSNYENVIIEEDNEVASRFEREFDRLKKVAKPYRQEKKKKSWLSRFTGDLFGDRLREQGFVVGS